MTEKTQAKSIEVTYGRALALLFSLALVLFCAAPSWAQTAPSAAKSSAKPAASATHKASSPSPAATGLNTGIKVRGHWVITVKNPDGTVATRREFDNSLQYPGQLGIAALIAGNVTGGGLAIVLNGNSVEFKFSADGAFQLSNLPTTSPCTFEASEAPGPCLITSYNSGQQPGIQTLCNSPAFNNPYGCSYNLSVTAPTLKTGGAGPGSIFTIAGSETITLSGSITAAAPGTITDVETWGFACVTSATAQSCNSSSSPSQAPLGLFYTLTERNLDGVNGDPPSVSVAAGQGISATVTLSFGSSD